jgi:transcriptional regulator with XRE-family HTH domain
LTATTAPEPTGRLYDHAKLLAWRVEADLTREQVCVEVGVSFPWLSALERGEGRAPSLAVLTRLARFYGHEPGELLTGGPQP